MDSEPWKDVPNRRTVSLEVHEPKESRGSSDHKVVSLAFVVTENTGFDPFSVP